MLEGVLLNYRNHANCISWYECTEHADGDTFIVYIVQPLSCFDVQVRTYEDRLKGCEFSTGQRGFLIISPPILINMINVHNAYLVLSWSNDKVATFMSAATCTATCKVKGYDFVGPRDTFVVARVHSYIETILKLRSINTVKNFIYIFFDQFPT
jgi:hypothetical protein